MTDRNNKDTDPTVDAPRPVPSPIPRNASQLAETVAAIATQVQMTNEIILPNVESAATEARDGVVRLDARVEVLEKELPHKCIEQVRQGRQDQDIANAKTIEVKQKEQLKGLFKFRNAIIAAIGGVVLLAGSFAILTRTTEATNATNIQTNKADIERHEEMIKALPTRGDLEAVKTAVANVPSATARAVKEASAKEPPTVNGVKEDVQDLPYFTDSERQVLESLLKRAHKRENGREKTEEQ